MKRRSELCKIDIDEYVWVLKSTFYVNDGISFLNLRFENDVEMYGTQTYDRGFLSYMSFENDVEMYGTQTNSIKSEERSTFENDVEMYGTQTSTF